MYYYLKTDISDGDYPDNPFRKGHAFGIYKADSPEEAERWFRRFVALAFSQSIAKVNRRVSAKRLAAKDFEVAEYIPGETDQHWWARIVTEH